MKYLVLSLIFICAVLAGLLLLGPRKSAVAPQNGAAALETVMPASLSTISEGALEAEPTSSVVSPTSVIEKKSISVGLSAANPRQGDTVRVDVSDSAGIPTVYFDDKSVPVFTFRNGLHALIPIGAHESVGKHQLRVSQKGESDYLKTITVAAGGFPIVYLGIPDKLDTTPAQLVLDLSKENADLNALVALITPNLFFSQSFGLPLSDNTHIVAEFGEIRKTGDQTISHLGVDFQAPEGSLVVAMNDGVVEEADSTVLYGNTVVINHGEGIFSMYLHLKTIKTEKGAKVNKGEVIGTVGQTGYATGPHLHLSVKVNGVSVDPIKFVDTF